MCHRLMRGYNSVWDASLTDHNSRGRASLSASLWLNICSKVISRCASIRSYSKRSLRRRSREKSRRRSLTKAKCAWSVSLSLGTVGSLATRHMVAPNQSLGWFHHCMDNCRIMASSTMMLFPSFGLSLDFGLPATLLPPIQGRSCIHWFSSSPSTSLQLF